MKEKKKVKIICSNYYRARTSVLGNIPGTNIYESIDACDEVYL